MPHRRLSTAARGRLVQGGNRKSEPSAPRTGIDQPNEATAPRRQPLGLQAIGPEASIAGTVRSTVAELGRRAINGGVLMKQSEHLPAVVLCATLYCLA